MGLDDGVMRPHGWTVILPIKALSGAKSRLRVPHAAALMRAFALDTLAAVSATPEVAEVLVATGDAEVSELARQHGAVAVDDSGHPGINAAAAHAARLRAGAGGIVVMVADLPALTPASLSCAIDLASAHATSILADAEGDGTCLWLAAPDATVATHFGSRSRAAHVAHGATDLVRVHPECADDLWPARCDVDTEDALSRAVTVGVGPATREILTRTA